MKPLAIAVTLVMAAGMVGCASTRSDSGPLTIAKQGSFFVGGKNVKSETLSNLPAYAPSGTITVNQVYVRYQEPVNAKKTSVVFIHGCCLTGKTWESTPDGRMSCSCARASLRTWWIKPRGAGLRPIRRPL